MTSSSSAVIRILMTVIFQVAISQPPSILRHPLPLRIFRSDEQIDLDCEAKGQPILQYRWLKGGVRIDDRSHPNVQFMAENHIRILSASSLDEGLYSCHASNDLGTAVSNEAHLLKAVLGPFNRPGRLYSVAEYSSLRLECQAPVSLPALMQSTTTSSSSFSWVLARGRVDDRPTKIATSKRIQIDPITGDLCFSYATISDADGVYKCEIFNPFLDLRASGSYSRVNVTQRFVEISSPPPSSSSSPSILFFTDKLVVLEQSTAALHCFFSGHPEVNIRWQRLDGDPIPFDRIQLENFDSQLTISNVDQTDEADYVCIGGNDVGEEQEQIIHLSVQAAPRFLSSFDRPRDINVTDGDRQLTINCQSYAEPTADVTWYQNAIPINFSVDGNNKVIAELGPNGSSSIVISRVCKNNCSSSSSVDDDDDVFGHVGSTVIQCKATNIHGSVFANGYINALDRTRITVRPTDESFELGENVTFECKGISDPTTDVDYEWYHNGSLLISSSSSSSSSPNDPSVSFCVGSSGSTLHMTTAHDKDGGMSRVGNYLCRVSNGYSMAEASANLVLYLIVADVEQATVSLNLAWLLTLLFLLLLLLLLCCVGCCLKFRVSDNYNVDEKEKRNGLYPETELANLDFKVYIRNDGAVLSKSLVSLDANNSQTTTLSKTYIGTDAKSDGKSEDGGSWNFDRWFNEDGSFIGAYKEKQ